MADIDAIETKYGESYHDMTDIREAAFRARLQAYMATTGVVNVSNTIQLDLAGCPLTCLK